jgi:hypothetical protein
MPVACVANQVFFWFRIKWPLARGLESYTQAEEQPHSMADRSGALSVFHLGIDRDTISMENSLWGNRACPVSPEEFLPNGGYAFLFSDGAA